jgi:hemerythrin-like domain-containing protein
VKRAEALASLSRDHHHALVVAQALRRADAATVADARTRFLDFWTTEGHEHFRIEEDLLFPGFAAHGDAYDPLVLRALGDHVAIRQRADALTADPDPAVDALHDLGARLAAHVRLEERELFPLIEQTLSEDALVDLARRMERAEEQR